MAIEEANKLSEEEAALVARLPRVSLGKFRALFVIYCRLTVQSGARPVKPIYGNASTAQYLAQAQRLGIANIFYRLALENAGLIPMHPGHAVYWTINARRRRSSSSV